MSTLTADALEMLQTASRLGQKSTCASALVTFLLISSGNGRSSLPVRRPASMWTTLNPNRRPSMAPRTVEMVSPMTTITRGAPERVLRT